MCLVFMLGRRLLVFEEDNSSIARKMLTISVPYDNTNESDFRFVRSIFVDFIILD